LAILAAIRRRQSLAAHNSMEQTLDFLGLLNHRIFKGATTQGARHDRFTLRSSACRHCFDWERGPTGEKDVMKKKNQNKKKK
jgi:hypothetical protein